MLGTEEGSICKKGLQTERGGGGDEKLTTKHDISQEDIKVWKNRQRKSAYEKSYNFIQTTFRVLKHLSETFPIQNESKQGDALLPLLLKFDLKQCSATFFTCGTS
jgi:hypothetical protein